MRRLKILFNKYKFLKIPIQLTGFSLLFFGGWHLYPYFQNQAQTTNLNINEYKLDQTLNQEKDSQSESQDEKEKEEKSFIPKELLEEFTIQTLKTFNEKMPKDYKEKIQFQQLKNDTKINDKDTVIAFILSSQFDNTFMDKICNFLENVAKKNEEGFNVYLKIITSIKDLKVLEEQTKREFVIDNNYFNFMSVFNQNINKAFPLRPSDLMYSSEKILLQFEKPIEMKSQAEYQQYLKDLKADEVILISKNGKDQKNQIDKLKSVFYGSDKYNHKKFQFLLLDNQIDSPQLEDGINIIVKTKKDPDFILNQSKYKLVSMDSNQLTKEKFNENLDFFLSENKIFTNKFLQSKDRKYEIAVILDRNVITNDFVNYLENNIKKVKDKLGKNAELIKFSLYQRSLGNSEKKHIFIRAVESELQKKKLHLISENQNLEKYQNENKNNPKLLKSFSNSFIYNSENFSSENIYNFCDDLINEKLKYEPFSQKPFMFNKYSKKIVADNFKQNILDNHHNQLVFYYSKNCHSCKKFLPIYENLFKEYLANLSNKPVFNRMNNDLNHCKDKPYYSSTPKIAIYRADYKKKPYYYSHTKFNKNLFENFIDSTLKFSLMDPEIFQKVQSMYEQKEYQTEQILDFQNNKLL